MKELFVTKVVEETTDFLDNNQRIKLKEILTKICIYYRIEVLEQSQKEKIQKNNEDRKKTKVFQCSIVELLRKIDIIIMKCYNRGALKN